MLPLKSRLVTNTSPELKSEFDAIIILFKAVSIKASPDQEL